MNIMSKVLPDTRRMLTSLISFVFPCWGTDQSILLSNEGRRAGIVLGCNRAWNIGGQPDEAAFKRGQTAGLRRDTMIEAVRRVAEEQP